MSDILSLVFESPHAEKVATGFAFTEGPVWHPDGSLYFVDIRRSLQLRWSRKEGAQVVREKTGGGNGTTLDRRGRMVMCEGENRRVARKEADETWVTIADRLSGKRLNRPNDVVCRSDGSIYFTDPAGRLPESERELTFSGVFHISPSGRLSVATDECEYPNGLAFSPDERVLYVAISRLNQGCIAEKERGEVCRHQLIRAFDVEPSGALRNNRIFAELASAEEGVPDGMKADSKGRIFCTGPGGCWVYEPGGKQLGVIGLPEVPANLAFGGSDYRELYFTARTSVYVMRTREPGIPVLP